MAAAEGAGDSDDDRRRHGLWATTPADEAAARASFAPPPPPPPAAATSTAAAAAGAATGTVAVPRILHYIWLGSPLPPRLRRLVDTWRLHHPHWLHVVWTDADVARLPPLTNAAAYEAAANYGGRADVLRLEVLAAVGGVYVDMDMQCVGRLDGALGEATFAVGISHVRAFELNNAVLASTAAHPVMLGLMAAVGRGEGATGGDTSAPLHTIATTGPGLLTRRLVALMRSLQACEVAEGGGGGGSASAVAAVESVVAAGVRWCGGAETSGSTSGSADVDATFVERLQACRRAIAAIVRERAAAASAGVGVPAAVGADAIAAGSTAGADDAAAALGREVAATTVAAAGTEPETKVGGEAADVGTAPPADLYEAAWRRLLADVGRRSDGDAGSARLPLHRLLCVMPEAVWYPLPNWVKLSGVGEAPPALECDAAAWDADVMPAVRRLAAGGDGGRSGDDASAWRELVAAVVGPAIARYCDAERTVCVHYWASMWQRKAAQIRR